MFNFQRISFFQRSIFLQISAHRFRSRCYHQLMINIIIETKPVSLDNLSPVIRQILFKDPLCAVRCYEILSTNGDEDDVAHPSIVAFPLAENQFQIDLGTEDKSMPIHESARYFDCGVSLQCVDRTEL
ncbi:unnamed protein product [Rotaria sp. Silwood2]|nr:unnamed protein product [Rotaria sp. Silwood2]